MADGMKWRVNNAVTRSTLPPFARLIMFVLSNRADTRTAVIPDEHTPSLSTIADESGLGLATVKRHLNILEADGWVRRERPTDEERVRGVRTRYRLAIGSAKSTAHSEPRSTAQSEPSEASEHGSQRAVPGLTESLGTAQAEPRHGSQRAQSTAQSEPSTYIPIVSDLSDQLRGADAPGDDGSNALFGAPPKPESEGQRVNRLARTYTDRVKLSNFQAVAAIVRTAVRITDDEGSPRYGDQALTAALSALADEGRTVTANALRFALDGPPRASPRANGHQPYRNPVDQSVYLKGIS